MLHDRAYIAGFFLDDGLDVFDMPLQAIVGCVQILVELRDGRMGLFLLEADLVSQGQRQKNDFDRAAYELAPSGEGIIRQKSIDTRHGDQTADDDEEPGGGIKVGRTVAS